MVSKRVVESPLAHGQQIRPRVVLIGPHEILSAIRKSRDRMSRIFSDRNKPSHAARVRLSLNARRVVRDRTRTGRPNSAHWPIGTGDRDRPIHIIISLLVLTALFDHELQSACDHILEQFALELLIGAHANSD